MKEKIQPEGRDLVMQTYQSFWDDFEELVRQKVAPLVGKTFTQREWVVSKNASGRVEADWHTVKVTITHGEYDDNGLKIMGEYTHPDDGRKIETAFNPLR